MLIIGCDFHPGFQQIAIFDNQTGAYEERRLSHRAEAEQFYRSLAGQEVRVGMEACGHYPWFERLLAELGFELWLGDAGKIRASVVRQQKTDRRDSEHLQMLMRGPAERFRAGRKVGSYFGLIPSEYSSGGRQRLGHISKQGSSFVRFLLVEAGQSAARKDAELGRFYRRLGARKHRALAKVAVARKLAVRLYLMLREDWTYAQLCRAVVQASPSHSVAASKSRPLE